MEIVLPNHLADHTSYICEKIEGWSRFTNKSFQQFFIKATIPVVTHPIKFSITVGDISQLPKAFNLFFDLALKYNILAFKTKLNTDFYEKQLTNPRQLFFLKGKHIKIYGPHDSYLSPEKTLRTAQEWKNFFSELESLYRQNKIDFPLRENMPALENQIGDYCCYRVEYRPMFDSNFYVFINSDEQDTMHPWHQELNPFINYNNWLGSDKTTYQIHPVIAEEKLQEGNRKKALKLFLKIQKMSEDFKQCKIHINRTSSGVLKCEDEGYEGKLMIEFYTIYNDHSFFERKKVKKLLSFNKFLKTELEIPTTHPTLRNLPIGKERIDQCYFFAIEPNQTVIKKLQNFLDNHSKVPK